MIKHTQARAEPRNTLSQVHDNVLAVSQLNYNAYSTENRPEWQDGVHTFEDLARKKHHFRK